MTSIVKADGSTPTTPTPTPAVASTVDAKPTPGPRVSAGQGTYAVYVATANFLHPLGEFRDGVGYELVPADAKGLVDVGLLAEKV